MIVGGFIEPLVKELPMEYGGNEQADRIADGRNGGLAGVAMGFRRDGKRAHATDCEWAAWKDKNAELIREAGLPLFVLRSRRDWDYFLDNGYACAVAWGMSVRNIDFDAQDLTEPQRGALRRLLTEEELANTAVGHVLNGPPKLRESTA